MDVYLWAVGALTLVGITRAVWSYAHPNGRWGEERVATGAIEGGAYRSAAVYESRDRRAPKRVLWASILGRTWAALTAFVFAPAGLLGALMMGAAGSHSPFGTLFVVTTLALSISGVALGAALVGATSVVTRREASIRSTLTYSHAHHALVFANFLLAALAFEPSSAVLVLATVLPTCLVGTGITLLLGSANRLIDGR